MKKVFALCIGVLLFASCYQDTIVPEIEEINIDQSTLARQGDKVDVCHKGNVISVSVNSVSAHQGHGDAVDMDGDGYFDIENDCHEGIDCDDTNPDVNCYVPQLGDFHQGGVVFYIFQLGETGYVDGETHGFVCSIVDLEDQYGSIWGPELYVANTLTSIGSGAQNTEEIRSQLPWDNTMAAVMCLEYYTYINGVYYHDWFLPSKDELNEMYLNKTAINATVIANGGEVFSNIESEEVYWSSSEYDDFSQLDGAWAQDFNSGIQGSVPKLIYYFNDMHVHVRAVRAF